MSRQSEQTQQRDLARFRELWGRLRPDDRRVASAGLKLIAEGRAAEVHALVDREART